MFSNTSISTRLFNGYFIIIIFLGIVTLVALVKLGSVNYLKKVFIESNTRIEYVSNLEIYKERLKAKTLSYFKESSEQEAYEDCLNILNNMKDEILKLISVSVNNPLLLQLSNGIKSHCDILHSEYNVRPYPSKIILLSKINNLDVTIDAFKHESYKNIHTLESSYEGVIWSALLTILAFLLITVVCSIFLSINIASSITNPLAKLMDTAKRIRGGDLSVRVNANTYDEIGTLAKAFNKMIDALNIDQRKIKEYSKNLEVKNLELKNLSHRMLSVQEDERKRLSQVLHEEVGQSLSALKINIKLLEHYNKNSKNKFEQSAEFPLCVEDCRKIVDMTFKSLKSLTFNLRYNILDTIGVLAATTNFIEQVSKRVPIRIITSGNVKEENIPEHIKMYLFRIIREAITNIIKHAKATLIRLEFILETNTVVLRIIDNGCGFDVEDILGKDMEEFNMGITTIKELVAIMKGDLQVTSKSSKGTSLTIKVPC